MSVPALVARLRASESPTVWAVTVTACRVARRLSRHRSRWSSRLGYALERLDQARESRQVAALHSRPLALEGSRRHLVRRLREARRHERNRDWLAAAAAYRQLSNEDEAVPSFWYRLGWCLWHGGDLPGAARAVREACQRDGSEPRWFNLLADIQEAAGDLPAAASARQQAVRLAGQVDPQPRLSLAALYDRVGQWADAQRLLRENAEQHPDHAPTHRRLGEISLHLARWGGAFTDTLARRGGGFRFDQPVGSAATTARQALERVARLEPAKTSWRPALAEARLADGDLRGAAALYEAALRHAEESTGRWVLAVKQRWQFALESIYHRLDEPRVRDPLFDCAVRTGVADASVDRVAGLFEAQTTFGGLAVMGMVVTAGVDHVEIRLSGRPLRTLKIGGDGYFPRFHPRSSARRWCRSRARPSSRSGWPTVRRCIPPAGRGWSTSPSRTATAPCPT
jgi:tetratricopeptide (TPR) repeat protein